MSFFFYYLISCTLLQYCNKFTVMQIKLVVVVLGLTISNDLTWNAHITEIIKKASKRPYFLIQLKRANVSEGGLSRFYTACIRSV